jgi:excisionase family DNA binding protein
MPGQWRRTKRLRMDVLVQPEQALLLTIPEAAAMLRIGRATLYNLISDGEIPVVKVGRSARIRREALNEWVEQKSRNHTAGVAG